MTLSRVENNNKRLNFHVYWKNLYCFFFQVFKKIHSQKLQTFEQTH